MRLEDLGVSWRRSWIVAPLGVLAAWSLSVAGYGLVFAVCVYVNYRLLVAVL